MPMMSRRGWLLGSVLAGASAMLGWPGLFSSTALAAQAPGWAADGSSLVQQPPSSSAQQHASSSAQEPLSSPAQQPRSSVVAQQAKHPNVDLIERYYAAYGRNDLAALREQFFAPDIRWHIPGHHPLAGTKHGVDEVVAFFGQLGRAGFKAETVFLEANEEWVVDLHRGWSEAGPGLDQMWALAFRVRDGKIVEAVNYPSDQHAADAFFWTVYRLRPLPDRLATEEP